MARMPYHFVLSVFFVFLFSAVLVSPAYAVFINEIHYDNSGADSGEAVELAGATGADLTGWSLVFYNGSDPANGVVYNTLDLSGVFPNLQAGFGVLSFSVAGIQNGANDGLALVNSLGDVEQFLSYEGILQAGMGPAMGTSSDDIGVSEGSTTPAGYSLQLAGTGNVYQDFVWQVAADNTFGALNHQQIFQPTAVVPQPVASNTIDVPEPASIWLLLTGLLLLWHGSTRINPSRWMPGRDVPEPA